MRVKLGYLSKRPRSGGQRGYVLIVIALFVTLLAISLAAMDINTRLQLRRDREEEMIHRGVEYARAIKKFQKKFGRFPAKLEDLENTNNLRFLRHRYKDPITNAAWTPLRFGDVKLATNTAVPGAAIGAAPGAPIAGAGAQAGLAAGATQSGTSSGLGTQNPSTGTQSSTSPFGSGQALGGGAIVGVASSSEANSIREFGGKNHYNEWQFIAVTLPGNALIRGPYIANQGGMLGAGLSGVGGVPGVPGGPILPNIPGLPGAAGSGGQLGTSGVGGRGPRR
jgi:hypothetical protein